MKKLFVILTLTIFGLNAKAQDIYIAGYYNTGNGTIAALYKNGERFYTAHHPNQSSKATKVTCNSQGDVYWWINYYDYPSNNFNHSEIRVNDQVYATTEGHSEIHVSDIYCLNNTVYYAGYQYNEDSIMVATVWKGEDFSTHWIMGDGIHPSYIYDVDVDKRTGIPYFCGYIIDEKEKASVWEQQELLYTFDQDSLYCEITSSYATQIAVENNHIYTLGKIITVNPDYFPDVIWEDNIEIKAVQTYWNTIHAICTFENNYYYAISDNWYDAIWSRDQAEILILQYAYKIFSSNTNIYVIGKDSDNKFYIWENFEKQCQIEDCDAINDACVFDPFIAPHSEWYYEIQNNDGSITYQHLEYTADTTIGNQRPKVIVRSNTQYDRDTLITEVTHEYVYEENGKVYWWNRDLEDFTVLYDFAAQPGDEWEIKVGTESLIMHVDTVENYVYEGKTYRMLHVSDANDFFSGDIVCGVGHLTSFFPERLMNRGQNRYVNGLRCYWIDDELILKIGNKNCDAVYNELHNLNQTEPYYGFIYQPDTAIIYLSPNNPYEVNNNQLYAGFRYSPNGLLERSYVETYDMYGHWMHYYYDSDLHVILEDDTYFDLGAATFQNQYSYEDGLLMNYSRYYDNYHEQTLTLLDSISYSYDELRRLQTEKRFQSTTYEKTYEYNENEVIITTDGYSNGTNGDWIRLDKETRGFSEDSLLLTQQNEPYNDSATLVTYGYDEQGHRVSALTQNRYNGAWKNQKLVQYHFNPYGHLILAEIKLWQEDEFVNANRAIYELNEMGYPSVVTFEKWDGEAWVDGVWQPEFYLYNEDHLKQQNDMLYDYRDFVNKIEMTYVVTENPREPLLPDYCEWFYEIENENGSTTYQHLEYAGDTTINNERPKVIVRSNTQYDRDTIFTEVTHEYIYEENGIVYWWNKDLEEFTMLYDLTADVGDEWEIKVGTESLIMHVDAVENYEYEGKTYRMLRVSDENDLFSGNIVSGVGHLTSFFPERLMNRDKGYRVTGLRCYWVEGNLILKINRDDCDAIYAQLHNGIEEDGPSTGSGTLVVYPNPTDGYLVLETQSIASLQTQTYRITNLMGQTLLQGTLIAETQQIDISSLPAGMYFINVSEQTVKFVVK